MLNERSRKHLTTKALLPTRGELAHKVSKERSLPYMQVSLAKVRSRLVDLLVQTTFIADL